MMISPYFGWPRPFNTRHLNIGGFAATITPLFGGFPLPSRDGTQPTESGFFKKKSPHEEGWE
ncbi:hypothetical protein [Cupriavidus pauculus]|uniref:hypothetical protein n=1 Tax=Cupriavidus pauculus TaxID=82633 RepID=UPI001FD4A9F6|nr:hypothetical protein [Cupriavidus pauculus]